MGRISFKDEKQKKVNGNISILVYLVQYQCIFRPEWSNGIWVDCLTEWNMRREWVQQTGFIQRPEKQALTLGNTQNEQVNMYPGQHIKALMINISGTTGRFSGCSFLMVAEWSVLPTGRITWVKEAFSHASFFLKPFIFWVILYTWCKQWGNERMGRKMFSFIYLAETSDKNKYSQLILTHTHYKNMCLKEQS